MKKFVVSILLVGVLAAGSALAQGLFVPGQDGSATATQEVTIIIPDRVALHITETAFSLDLNYVPAYDSSTGEGCRLVPEASQAGIDNYLDLERVALANRPVDSYPARVLDTSGDVAWADGVWQKGGLACFNRKIIQKFSNDPDGWVLTVDVPLPDNVGQFGIIDRADPIRDEPPLLPDGQNESDYRHLIDDEASDLILAEDDFGTRGFLDDYITEIFYFDGSELPTDADGETFSITFTLSGKP